AFGLPCLGKVEKPLFRRLDLLRRLAVEIVAKGFVDDVLADGDELAAEMEVVDGAAVILGVDNGYHRGGKPREILRPADLLQRAILVEEIFQRDRIGELAALHQLGDRAEDAAMDAFGEMRRFQEFGDAVIGGVVDENRAQQRLLCFEIGRRGAVLRIAAFAKGCDIRGGGGFHDRPMLAKPAASVMTKRYPALCNTGTSRLRRRARRRGWRAPARNRTCSPASAAPCRRAWRAASGS